MTPSSIRLSAVGQVGRRVVPAPLRRRLIDAATRLRGPVLSVVMPVYNVEPYLLECLESMLSQDFRAFELLAVDDGSTDRSAAMLRAAARRDRRVRVMTQANAGQGPARNLALSRARGEFLVFVDSDDLVPPGSFRYLVGALRRSGSDFAVAGVRRRDGMRTFRPSWTVVVHEHDRVGITIDDFPAAMADVVAHHRIFRRRFWMEKIGGFSAGVYEDHVPMVAAYLRARSFDLLRRVTYDWRLRAEGTSTGQQKHDLENLRTRVAVKARARELVWREASEPVRAAWVGRVLDIDFPAYIDHALRGEDGYRYELAAALSLHAGLATPQALAHVRVQQKVRTHLAAAGAWDALERSQRWFDELGSIPPTTVRAGRVVLRDPTAGTGAPLPAELIELGRSECRLQVCLLRAEWLDPGALRLTGWAVVRAVDLEHRHPRLALSLVAADGSAERTLSVEPVVLPEATRWVSWPHGSFDRAGFVTRVDVGDLAAQATGEWRLRARLEVDGLVREGAVHHAVAGSSASRGSIAPQSIDAGTVAVPHFDGEHGFAITLERRTASGRDAGPADVVDVSVEADRLWISLRAPLPVAPVITDGSQAVAADRVEPFAGATRYGFALRARSSTGPARPVPSGVWRVVRPDTGGPLRFQAHVAQRLPIEELTDAHRVRLAVHAGEVRVELDAPLTDDELGARAQHVLREAYQREEITGRNELVVIPGDSSASAVLERLVRRIRTRRAATDVAWTVVDLAEDRPEGIEAIVAGTRRWYGALAAAHMIVMATEPEWWFRSRPFQHVVRVFGDATPPVGRSRWWQEGWTPGRIAHEIERRAATWDEIVVPDESSVDRYRRELDWNRPITVADAAGESIVGRLPEATAER